MNRLDYVKQYYEKCHGDGSVDKEIEEVGKFLAENVKGKVLDCGCGPVPQLWAICMPSATEIHAIDLPKESIDFVKNQIATKEKWYKTFFSYQEIVENIKGKLPDKYILNQIDKIKSVQQADMTKSLPFPENYFDMILSLYSLGVLRSEQELDKAIRNISKVLKKGGKLLHINTDGKNSNSILPEYTWQGLSQTIELIEPYLVKYGFDNVKVRKIPLKTSSNSMYKYNNLFLLSAIKK